mgnify:FL=1
MDSFEDIMQDPQTVHSLKTELKAHTYWSDYKYIPEDLIVNIQFLTLSPCLTSLQDELFSKVSGESNLYQVVAGTHTGKSLGVGALAATLACQSRFGTSVLWISASDCRTLLAKSMFGALIPQIDLRIEASPKIGLFSLASQKKNLWNLAYSKKEKIKMIVLDESEEIMEEAENRKFLGSLILEVVFAQSNPQIFLLSEMNTVNIGNFVHELEQFSRAKGIQLSSSMICEYNDCLKEIHLYYITSDEALNKILSSDKVEFNKGVLIYCTNKEQVKLTLESELISYRELDYGEEETSVLKKLKALKEGVFKALVTTLELPKQFQSLGVDCVVHMSLPLDSESKINILEFEQRVLRVSTPTYKGISVMVVESAQLNLVHELERERGISIQPFPN